MNAPQLDISRLAFAPSRWTLAALCAIAPLLVLGCGARTPLHLHSGSSAEESADAGDETGGAVAATGGGAAGAVSRGGAGGPGGNVTSSGGHSSAGASGGSVGGTANGGISAAGGRTAIGSGGHTGGSLPMVGGATPNMGGMMAGGAITTGNTIAAGGGSHAGGSVATGGSSRAGGSVATGGGSHAGGSVATGGGSHAGGSVATGGTAPPGTPTIQPDGYVTLDTGTTVMMGHVSSYESGSGSSITLTYGTNSFCASGTVAADSTYASWAGAGFNVNQAESGASGSSGSLVLSGSSISLSYVNHAGSTLRLQLYDGSDYWCTTLPAATSPTTITIPFSQLNTQCWSGLGSAFVSGTPITAVQLMVPCSGFSPTPFDFCFLGLTVQ